MSSTNNQKNELFGFNLIIFNYIALFAICAAGAMLWFGVLNPNSHQDKQAVNAVQQVVAALRPVSVAKARFSKAEQLGCKKTSNIGDDIRELELQLAVLAGINEQGKASGNYRLLEQFVVDTQVLAQAHIQCDALQRGFKLLLSQNSLAQLHWANESVNWRKKQQKSLDAPWASVPTYGFMRSNPWGGLPGCVTMGEYYVDNGHNAYCAQIGQQTLKPISQLQHATPTSLSSLTAEVDAFRAPSSIYYRQITANKPNQITLQGKSYAHDIGLHLNLTLNPNMQQLAQSVALCYAGDQVACGLVGIKQGIGERFYEHAAARMTGIAIVDVASGRIEALASADTPCFQQQYDGPGRASDCPPLPRKPRYRPDMLLNHAVYTDVMPASTVKPILALGLISTAGYQFDQAQMTHELKTSNSARFLDHLFCVDKPCAQSNQMSFSPQLGNAQQAATLLGWNDNCRGNSALCGFQDILLGRPADEQIESEVGKILPIGTRILYGRLFTDEKQQLMSERDFRFNAKLALDCSSQKWRKCSGNAIANTASEAWGQGNARATILGVAGLYARLAAAANGYEQQRSPYLLERVSDVTGKVVNNPVLQPAAAQAIRVNANLAERVVNGMTQSHRSGGTAHLACTSAGIKNCDQIDWIAGKTGTPPFGFDNIKLTEIAVKCDKQASQQDGVRCSSEVPYKWYAAVFKSSPQSARYDKAIAVLSERNWYQSGPLAGKIDAPGDAGSNVSAEIAFRIMTGLRNIK